MSKQPAPAPAESSRAPSADAAPLELTITRELPAPPDLVLKAFTEPHRLMHWFCPKDFTVLFASVDARAGGSWRSGMRGPDGKEYIHRGVYRELTPGRLVFTHGWEKDSDNIHAAGHESIITVTLEPRGRGTAMTFVQRGFINAESRDSHRGGWSEAFDNAAAYLKLPAVAAEPSDRELVVTRYLAAPPALAWKAFTTAEHISRWWGPRGFSTTTESMDVRPGGLWRFTMHGPDGVDYPNLIRYEQVEEPRRLTYQHSSGEGAAEPVDFRVEVTFVPRGQGTEVTFRMIFDSPGELESKIIKFGADEGLAQTMTRLTEQVVLLREGDQRPFVISRVFNVSRQRMWEAWTQRKHYAQWFGPKGSEMPVLKGEVAEGQSLHYRMTSAGGPDMWGKANYMEVTPPDRLVWVQHFSDEAGTVQPAPFPEPWPLKMLTIVDFTDEGGGTKVTIQWSPWEAGDAEWQTFNKNRASMTGGWSGSLDDLEAYLKQ